jgi:8-oxo-dGTP pyrophosphatase MutT (NUDIX family)
MHKQGEPAEIVAAGGIIVDDEGRVLVVHRPHYDDWSFPKGKVDKGESIEAAAIREVREEAGLECEIVGRLSSSHYAYTTRKGEVKPKVVHYFLMKVRGGQLVTDGKETDEALWCNTEEAEKKLSYDGDREKLRELI